MFSGMPHAFRRYADLWASKRFDQVLCVLINWALERTMSMDDFGFHIEQRPDEQSQQEDKKQPQRPQNPNASQYMKN